MALVPAVLAPQGSHVSAAGTAAGWQEAVIVAGIDPVFLAGAGWDPVRLVLSPPAEHALLGRPVCRAGGCMTTAQVRARFPGTPLGGSPSRLRFQALHRFHGLHPDFGGSALPAPALTGGTPNDAAGFASCYGPHRRSPLTGLLTLGSDPARFQAEPPACYRASWQLPGPDFHRQATTSLRTRKSTMALRHGVTSCSAGRTKNQG